MEINSQSITAQLDQTNKFCVDWNSFGCVAYASSNIINIVDTYSMKVNKNLILIYKKLIDNWLL